MHANIWFKASIALNIALLAVIAHSQRSEKLPEVAPIVSKQQTVVTSQAAEFAHASKSVPSGLKQWVDLLRDAGASDSFLATIIQTDFDQHWQTRYADMQRKYQDGEVDINDMAILNADREMELEKQMQNELGEKGFKSWDEARQFSDINVAALNLTPAETDSLYQWRKRLQQQFHDADIAKAQKEIDQAEYDNRREAANAEYQQQLRLLLGYQRYKLAKGSGIPADVQHTLKEMKVGDDQLMAMENIEHQWGDQQAALQQKVEAGELNQADFEQQMQALQDWQQQKLQSTLGTNAFDYFQKQQDQRYVDMQSYAGRWGLGEQDVEQIYRTLSNYDKTVQSYKSQISVCEASGDSAKKDEIKNSLTSFANQTQQSLRQYLGQDRFNTLKNNHILSFN